MMDYCWDCFTSRVPWLTDEILPKIEQSSDFLIAIAYFSITMELIYIVHKSVFFPYRWVLMQFGALIVLGGATHLINYCLWMFSSPHYSKTTHVDVVMTIAKVSTAALSTLTALMLLHIVPDLLCAKTREYLHLIKNRAVQDQVDLFMKQEEESARHVRMLTHQIRTIFDRLNNNTINNLKMISSTLVFEVARTLGLEECGLWMPSPTAAGSTVLRLQLSQHMTTNLTSSQIPLGHGEDHVHVQMNLPMVTQVLNSPTAIRIPYSCPLAATMMISQPTTNLRGNKYGPPPDVVAVRVPLLLHDHLLSNFQIQDCPDHPASSPKTSYAVMVFVLPSSDTGRKWREHDLELAQVVADQMAIALSGASILENSI